MKKNLKNLLGLLAICAICQPAVSQCGSGGGGGSTSTSTASSSVSSFGTAGTSQQAFNNFMSQVNMNQSYQQSTESFYAQTDGSPYLYDDFQEGSIVMNNDAVIPNVQLNYDGYTGDIIAVNDVGEKIALDSRYYKEVIVQTDQGEVLFSKVNPNDKDKFYQVLYDNSGLAFYKDNYTTLREGSNNGIINTPSKFVQRNTYYVINEGQDPVAVNLKKRDLFDHFPEIEMVAINEVLKKKKIKLKKESDYMALFAQL